MNYHPRRRVVCGYVVLQIGPRDRLNIVGWPQYRPAERAVLECSSMQVVEEHLLYLPLDLQLFPYPPSSNQYFFAELLAVTFVEPHTNLRQKTVITPRTTFIHGCHHSLHPHNVCSSPIIRLGQLRTHSQLGCRYNRNLGKLSKLYDSQHLTSE